MLNMMCDMSEQNAAAGITSSVARLPVFSGAMRLARNQRATLTLVEPLLRAGLWAMAFWIAYRAQIRLEHHHHGGTEIAYLIVACAMIGVAAWPRPVRATVAAAVPRTSAPARFEWLRAMAVPLGVLSAAAALGLFFRIHDLGSRPVGIWYDEAQNGLLARGILHGKYPPMFIGGNTQLPSAFFYVYAAFAWIMGEGVLSLRVVSTIGGLAALPLVYLLARELFGMRTGVLAIFMLAVMRWHVNLSRFGVTNIFASCFVLGAVYFFIRGLRGGRRWNLVASGVFVGLTPYAGFYGAFVPIVIVLYWLHAGIFERVLTYRRHLMTLLIVAGAALAVYSPVAVWGLKNREAYTSRPGTASIWKGKTHEQTYHAVLTSTRKHLLMFNSAGDKNGRHNLPGAPMLDRFTGIFFLLGLGLAAWRIRRSSHFLLLVWLAVFLQNGIWSVDFEAPQAFRSSVVTPAVAMLASLPLAALWNIAARSRRPREPGSARLGSAYLLGQEWLLRAGATAAIALFLVLVAYRNYDKYFNTQLDDTQVWLAFNTDITLVARDMKEAAEADHRILISSLFSSPVIPYVDPEAGDLKKFQLDLLRDVPVGDDKPTVFLLDATKRPYIAWIQQLYPNAVVTEIKPPGANQMPLVYKAVIPRDSVVAMQGLQASYEHGGDATVVRRDGTVDFDWTSQSPPVAFPFHAHWSGTLRISEYKDRLVSMIAPGAIKMSVDGQVVAEGNGRVDWAAKLYRGAHAISIDADVTGPGRVTLLDDGPPASASNLFSGATIDGRHGLLASFFHNLDFSGPPVLQELDPFVGFRYHAELPFATDFSATWKGHLDVPQTGTYGFELESIDQSQLTIDGATVIDYPGKGATKTTLPAGKHDIELRFKNKSGYATMFLRWEPPGGEREVVPSERLTP